MSSAFQFLVGVCLAGFAPTLAAQGVTPSYKLNGPLARGVAGEISFLQASPDGRFLVYTADRDGDDVFALYSVPSSGHQAPMRLFGPVPEYLYHAQFTRDGASVLFLVDLDGNGSAELAKVPVDGSAPPTPLSGQLDESTNVTWFQQSQDGTRVLFVSNPGSREPFELFSVPIGGGVAVRLNGPLVPGGNVQVVVLSGADLVLYSADQDTDERVEHFVAPIDGSSPARKLPIPLVPGGSVALLQFDPAGSHVLYIADQEEDERHELFSVPSDGSEPPRKLNGPLVPGGDVGNRHRGYSYPFFTVTLDGNRVVYTADQDTDEHFELYSVPADGSRAPAKLNAPSEQQVYFETSSHDSDWVVYSTYSRPGRALSRELFTAPVDGSSPARRISGPLPGGDPFFPQVSPDDRHVVFLSDQDVFQVFELFSAPIDGTTPPVKLNPPLAPGGDVPRYSQAFWVLEDGVAYLADQERDEIFELYLAPITGGVLRKLASGPVNWAIPTPPRLRPPRDSGGLVFFRERELLSLAIRPGGRAVVLDELSAGAVVGDVEDLELTPAGDRVVYRAREEGDQIAELHSVQTSRPLKPLQLSEVLQSVLILSRRLTPDGGRVVFEGKPSFEAGTGLYSSPIDAEGRVVELRAPLGPNVFSTWSSYEISPDGQRVAFMSFTSPGAELFGAPVDGTSPAVHLGASLPPGWHVTGPMRFSPDGSRIAFRGADSGGLERLYTVLSDGSAPAEFVLEAQDTQSDYQFADADRIVYRTVGSKDELYIVPADLSAPPMRLNGALPARGDVTAFALTADGTRAVYHADPSADETFELFSVTTDGSAPDVRLHAALPAGRDVRDFQISSDGRRVVYRADALADEQLDLFSVPIDASRPPVRLNRNLVAAGDVQQFQISPNGTRVVYLEENTDGVVDLFSTPVLGPRGGVRLSRSLVPGGSVRSFRISADSSTVAFTAERNAEHALTLLSAPIRGQEAATELAGPFQGGGSVGSYRLSSDGSVVVYAADQEEDGVIELFAARR